MANGITREELFARLWRTPMVKLADELNTTTSRLTSLCRQAGIPTPPPGFWMKVEFGKEVAIPQLGAAPEGYDGVLTIDEAPREEKASPKKTEQSKGGIAPEAEVKAQSPAQRTPPPRPTAATALTREALYEEVWHTPMARLAEEYGVSDVGLAKICKRADVPIPPRGYWAKSAAGKVAPRAPLPKAGPGVPSSITIHPTPAPAPEPVLDEQVRKGLDAFKSDTGPIVVADRLLRPHPIVAGWLQDHDEAARRARQERDPNFRKLMKPADFTESQRRQHRVLDALFKALERNGAKVRKGERELVAELLGEKIEFSLRERHKQVRRPLTAEEERWYVSGRKWKQELEPTGLLVFEVKTRLPASLKTQWQEAGETRIDEMLRDIVATFVAAGPLLVEQRKEAMERERLRQIAERERYEEQQRRKREANRWRKFTEIAIGWREHQIASEFLAALRAVEHDPEQKSGGEDLATWMAWAEERLRSGGPLANGPQGVFDRIADVREWTY